MTSPDVLRSNGRHDDDVKRPLPSIGDMSAIRNIYNGSKNTAGTSSNGEKDGANDLTSNQVNVQSILKFCSGYSIENQNLTHDNILKSQQSYKQHNGNDLTKNQINGQDRSLQNLCSS